MKENNEKKIKNCDEISKLIKAFPKLINLKIETEDWKRRWKRKSFVTAGKTWMNHNSCYS